MENTQPSSCPLGASVISYLIYHTSVCQQYLKDGTSLTGEPESKGFHSSHMLGFLSGKNSKRRKFCVDKVHSWLCATGKVLKFLALCCRSQHLSGTDTVPGAGATGGNREDKCLPLHRASIKMGKHIN